MIIHIKIVPVNKCEECHKRSLKEIIFQALKNVKDKIEKKEYDINLCDSHHKMWNENFKKYQAEQNELNELSKWYKNWLEENYES